MCLFSFSLLKFVIQEFSQNTKHTQAGNESCLCCTNFFVPNAKTCILIILYVKVSPITSTQTRGKCESVLFPKFIVQRYMKIFWQSFARELTYHSKRDKCRLANRKHGGQYLLSSICIKSIVIRHSVTSRIVLNASLRCLNMQ